LGPVCGLEAARKSTYSDTRVALGGVGRDGLEVVRGRRSRAAPGDDELGTLGVELGSVGLVESEQLVADEIVARNKVGGDLARPLEGLQIEKQNHVSDHRQIKMPGSFHLDM
jgi:hypothetical protein